MNNLKAWDLYFGESRHQGRYGRANLKNENERLPQTGEEGGLVLQKDRGSIELACGPIGQVGARYRTCDIRLLLRLRAQRGEHLVKWWPNRLKPTCRKLSLTRENISIGFSPTFPRGKFCLKLWNETSMFQRGCKSIVSWLWNVYNGCPRLWTRQDACAFACFKTKCPGPKGSACTHVRMKRLRSLFSGVLLYVVS